MGQAPSLKGQRSDHMAHIPVLALKPSQSITGSICLEAGSALNHILACNSIAAQFLQGKQMFKSVHYLQLDAGTHTVQREQMSDKSGKMS